MKLKNILGLLIISIMLITANCSFAALSNKTIHADIGTKRIPSGTILRLKLLDPINSDMMEMGDQFSMMTTEDIKVDGLVVLPTGSIVRGSIQKIKQSRMLSRSATVYLDFDHVVAPTGKQISLRVGICNNPKVTIDGGLGEQTNYRTATVQNAKNTAKIVKTSTNWGWNTGGQVLSGYPKYALAPLSAVFSAPVAGIYFMGDSIIDLIKKGDDLSLNQGDKINLMLLKPLDIPVY